MRILQLCNKPPFPPIEGGPIAMNAITQGLIQAGHKVKVLAVTSYKFPIHRHDLPETYLENTGFIPVFLDLKIHPFKAFLNLFSNKSFHVQRFISKDFEEAIGSALIAEKFDVVHIESIFLASYIDVIRQHTKAKIVIRTHNVEHQIWERLAGNTINVFKKWYLHHIASTLKSFELKVLNEVDGVMTISKNDADFFLKHGVTKPMIELPFGVNLLSKIPTSKINNKRSLFFIGSLNWQPNLEGVEWFLKNVWLNADLKLPDVELFIAGRHIPDSLKSFESNRTHIVGEVKNALEFMSKHSIMIVPLFSGSGVRIKIIEGLMMGKAIISTTIGAEGINCTDGENIILANNPAEFATAINDLVENSSLFEQISTNAPYLIEKEHNNEQIIPKLIQFYNTI